MIRWSEFKQKVGRGRSTTWRDVRAGLMPPSIALGPKCQAWVESEVDAVLAARVAGATEGQIKQLVKQLVAARRAGRR